MGAGLVSEIQARPCLFRHSYSSWVPWGWPTFGWGLAAGGKFFAGDWVSLAPCAGAWPVVDVAGSAVL